MTRAEPVTSLLIVHPSGNSCCWLLLSFFFFTVSFFSKAVRTSFGRNSAQNISIYRLFLLRALDLSPFRLLLTTPSQAISRLAGRWLCLHLQIGSTYLERTTKWTSLRTIPRELREICQQTTAILHLHRHLQRRRIILSSSR